MRNFEVQIRKEITRMELIDIHYINVQHNSQTTEPSQEIIDELVFIFDYKSINPKKTFEYKVFSMN